MGDATKACLKCAAELDSMRSERDAAVAALATATKALQKIDAIRDSIVGTQSLNWSEHIYPLAAALGEAGYKGAGHAIAAKNMGTLIDRTNAAELALATARALAMAECAKLIDSARKTVEADPDAERVVRAAVKAASRMNTGFELDPIDGMRLLRAVERLKKGRK